MATGSANNTSTSNTDTFAEMWNGTTWTIVTTPSITGHTDDTFNAVSCTEPTSCMAVGSDTVLGTGFDIPSPGSNSGSPQLGPLGVPEGNSVAHVVPHIATVTHVLAEQWNGTSWTVTTTVDPTGVAEPGFEVVSCAGTAFCMALGYTLGSAVGSFAEEWSGGTWSQTALPASPTSGAAVVIDVSCISATSCTGVGTAFKDSSNTSDQILYGSWNGSAWTLSTIATPADPYAAWLGVSCLGGGNCVSTGGVNTGTTVVPANSQAPIGRSGYRMVASDGGIFAFGPNPPALGAPFIGSMGGHALNAPIVGMAVMPAGDGYDLVASDGGVFNFGSAQFYGSMGGVHLNKPIVGMAITADGGGYWLVASDGGIFSFGDAQFYGSTGGQPLNKPVVGMAGTPNGLGYNLVASDGGIFSFGNAVFAGSTGSITLNKPVVGMAGTAAGGYYLVASDGGIFNYGAGAPFLGSSGSLALNKPVVGMGVTAGGYYIVASDGGIFTYPTTSGPAFYGSTGSIKLNKPIVGIGT